MPTCSEVVTQILPVVSSQTCKRERLDFNIIATYLDGHSEVVRPTSTTYNSGTTYNNQGIKINYTGRITNATTTGTLETTITVTTVE